MKIGDYVEVINDNEEIAQGASGEVIEVNENTVTILYSTLFGQTKEYIDKKNCRIK